MRVGIVILPEHDWGQDQRRWELADSLGFDHAWIYDHLAWRTLADGPWHATIPTLVAAALATSRIRLGTLVTTPNFRHPVPLAKELMTLDVMSGGRLNVALGAGAPGYDAAVLGGQELAPAARHERFIEFRELLDHLLSEPVTTWSGEWYSAVEARMMPGSAQQPRPPLLVAANGRRGMHMAVTSARRRGDGWVTFGPRDAGMLDHEWWEVVAGRARLMDKVVADEGGSSVPLTRLLQLGSRTSNITTAQHLGHHIERAAELGFTDVTIAWPRPNEPYRGEEGLLEKIAAALPHLRSIAPIGST